MKIGRLAVASNFNGAGIGRFILDSIKQLLAHKEDIACRFLTVDAYHSAIHFYTKNRFEKMSHKDDGSNTQFMYFDLKQIC